MINFFADKLRARGKSMEDQLGKIYQQIGETIVEMIPEEWEKVYLYAEVSEGFSYVYFYYCPVHHSSCLTSRKISYHRHGV
jgi:hypothetical protein